MADDQRLTAGIPAGMMWMGLTMMVVLDDEDQGKVKEIKTNRDDATWNVRPELQSWLDTCEGGYEILAWKVRFDLEQDYVRYCFDWL